MAPNTINPGHFGSLIVGEEAAKEEAAIVEKGGNIFGPLVVDAGASEGLSDAQEEALAKTLAFAPSNTKELETTLQEHPETFDALLEAEFMRPEGTRKTWLRIFLSAENARDGGPRPEVVTKINDALEVAAS